MDLVIRLPSKDPCSTNVAQEGEMGVSSTQASYEAKCKVVGKVIFTQIPTWLPIKPVVKAMTTILTTPNINIDVSKLQSNKGLSIDEGGSGSKK